MLRLRPHHLLCLQKYTGHGYDDRFTEKMNEVVRFLREEPETAVFLVCGEDDLCKSCPNNTDGRCSSQEKVSFMDESVLSFCGLKTGQPARIDDLFRNAGSKIIKSELFIKTCGSCQWFDLCKNTEKGSIYYEQSCGKV